MALRINTGELGDPGFLIVLGACAEVFRYVTETTDRWEDFTRYLLEKGLLEPDDPMEEERALTHRHAHQLEAIIRETATALNRYGN